MDERVRAELEAIERMVRAWKRDYLGWAPSEGGGEFLARELSEEIETHVYPYVRRLYECQYVSGPEAKAFLDACYKHVEDLRNAVRERAQAQ
jgi:hypothetical protein